MVKIHNSDFAEGKIFESFKDKVNEDVNDKSRDRVIKYYADVFNNDKVFKSSNAYKKLKKYYPFSEKSLSKLSNDQLQEIWDVIRDEDLKTSK